MTLNTLTWQKCLANLAPSGTIEITENGEYDVTKYAAADVNVSGGATVGDMVELLFSDSAPIVGGYCGDAQFIMDIKLGDSIVAQSYVDSGFYVRVASGTTVKTTEVPKVEGDNSAKAYIIEYEPEEYTVISFEEWDGEITMIDGENNHKCYQFTVPNLQSGKLLQLEYSANWD